jgi:hypothetical protein
MNEGIGLEEISVNKIKHKMLKPGPVSKPRAIHSLLKLLINSYKAAWFAAEMHTHSI